MMHNILKNILKTATVCLMLAGCNSHDNISTAVDGSEGPLVIYPDYKEVTIPVNIAPLNFHYSMSGIAKATTTFTLGNKSISIKGLEVEWSLSSKAFI